MTVDHSYHHPSPHRLYAFELNNMACALLRYGEFDAARETLEDALNLVYSGSGHNLPMAIPSSQLHLFAQQRLHRAFLRLSQFSSASSSWIPSEFLQVSLVASNDGQALKRAALNHGKTDDSLHFTCVLIRDAPLLCPDRLDLDKESGIILFNYALANYLLTCVTDGMEALPQNETLLSALSFAQTTFGTILDQVLLDMDSCLEEGDSPAAQQHQAQHQNAYDQQLSTIYLSMLFLAISGHIHRDSGDFGASMSAQFAMQGLLEIVGKHEILYHVQQHVSFGASRQANANHSSTNTCVRSKDCERSGANTGDDQHSANPAAMGGAA